MQVKLRIQVHEGFSGASSGDLCVEKMVELPIVPQKGMNIVDGDFESTVSYVYIYTDGRIIIWLRDDKTLYDEGLQHCQRKDISSEVWENRKKKYLAEEWQTYKKNGWNKSF